MDQISTIAHTIFGGEVKKRKEKFYNLQKQLRQARMSQSYEVYVSMAYLVSIIIGFIGAIVGVLLAFLVLRMVDAQGNFTNIHLPDTLAFLTPFTDIIVIIFGMALMSLIGYFVTYSIVMLIPSFNASERKTKINKSLPYAVTFMYALSKGGMDVISILRSLQEAENTYGEVSKEVGLIIRDMDYFGSDLRTAILNCIGQTPSDMLQDLLSNLLSVIDSGGDATVYLQGKTDQYLQRVMQDQKSFLEILGLIAESYVTAFVAGPLFIIIMSSVMTIMNGGSPVILYAIVYAVLPIGSVMFVVLISMLTPTDDESPKKFEIPIINSYDSVPIEESGVTEKQQQKLIQDLRESKKKLKFKEFTSNPLGPIKNDPTLSLLISVPVALIIISVLILLTFSNMTDAFQQVSSMQTKIGNGLMKDPGDPLVLYGPIIGYFDDFLIFFILLVITPLSLFYERKERRAKRIASEMPDFLKKLASTNETGMTLTQSLNLISNSNFGTLSSEVKKVWRDMQWGTDVNTAMKRFANSLKTSMSTRVMTLITKASESSGDIKDVLNVAANDAKIGEQIRRERFDGMLIYVVIIFISFCVFIYCVYTLTSSFIPVMASAADNSAASSSAATAGATFIQQFNPEDYVRLFFHAAIIQGLCAGMLAGQMGEGKWMSGLKYAIIMTVIAYVMFTIFI
ncbi:secretion system protein [Methanocella sp. CWC-04]|uniref:Secretion system protein n=1 Tax=Methanooceanicella nereidis TaxID=2052831 RepID=A0AAP2R9Z9_9EURY|nr:type II secretion system F family protein [Methanocella sp. CWC-04]MCD1293658.1 secretion system protein [Methanocella sp. CWC-04]